MCVCLDGCRRLNVPPVWLLYTQQLSKKSSGSPPLAPLTGLCHFSAKISSQQGAESNGRKVLCIQPDVLNLGCKNI